MKRTALLVSFTLLGALAAKAQPAIVKQFGDWGVYSYSKGGQTVCYVLTVPKSMEPASVDHGRNYFVIGSAPSSGYEPQAIMGYDLKPGSRLKVEIGDSSFAMFARGRSAWVIEEAREPEVIAALRSGSHMSLQAQSLRGTTTTYTYSLNGVSAALKRMSTCR
jgi:invasion protein IalB